MIDLQGHPVHAILFDYGGTLDGEGWHWFDRFLHLYGRLGLRASRDEIHEAFYAANEVMAKEAPVERYGLRAMIDRHVELQRERIAFDGDAARGLVGGFCEMSEAGWAVSRRVLEALRGQVRLGVVSNFAGNLDVLIEEAGLSRLLDTVVESAVVGAWKPDPEIYRIALERIGGDAATVAMVGDNLDRDVRPAQSLGMRGVWLRGPGSPPGEAGVADLEIPKLDDLLPKG